MSELYHIPLNAKQYGLLEIALRSLGTERALEVRSQIERQVMREGLRGITLTINQEEYDEACHALCELAVHSGVGSEAGELIQHMKYFTIGREQWFRKAQ